MLKRFVVFLALGLMVTLPALAADRDEDIHRMDHAARVFKEIMDTPDKGIPHGLLHDAKCIAIIPGELKFAFVFGGNYGRGVAVCRTDHGWGAPLFVAISGGSVGYQIGGSSTDLVLLFMKYVSDKYAGKSNALIDVPKGGGFADMVALKGNKEIGEKINKIIA